MTIRRLPSPLSYRVEISPEQTRARGQRWLATFPDCKGCFTEADYRSIAWAAAVEALDGWLLSHFEAGLLPPRPKATGGMRIGVRASLAVALQLRWRRDDLDLTQADLAKRIGLTQQQVARLEGGNANPTVKTLERVAKALESRLSVMFLPALSEQERCAACGKSNSLERRTTFSVYRPGCKGEFTICEACWFHGSNGENWNERITQQIIARHNLGIVKGRK